MTQDVRFDPGGLRRDEQLAGYQIQEQIGRGGMAVVYRALDLRLGRLVALKVLAGNPSADAAFRQRFIRESRAAAGLDHPHIIPVYDAGESGGVLFIAMRYCGAGDLRSLIDAERVLSPASAASIVSQVAAALDAAHDHGLVHRDVKPGNILLDQAGDGTDHVYLSDFGLIKHSLTPSTLTSTGQFLGTLDYVSPEQIQGRPVDGRADEYALACAAVEMLTGAPPFRRDDPVALMWAQLEAEPPRLTDRRPELPAAVDDVIATALAKKPEDRYPTCRDFATALSRACAAAPRAAILPATARQDRSGAPGSVPDAGGYDYSARSRLDDARDGYPAAPPAGYSPVAAASWPTAPPGDWTAAAHDGWPPAARDGWPSSARDDWPSSPPASWTSGSPGGLPAPDYAPEREQRHDGPADQPSGQVRHSARAHSARARSAPRPAGSRSAGSRSAGARRNSRTRALAALLAIAAIATIAVVAYRLAHRQHPAPLSTGQTTLPADRARPAQTVREYFMLINRHRYREAWVLSGEREPFASYAAGFTGTAHDAVTILSVKGNVVTAQLVARQTDGSVRVYQGTYTVIGGRIASTNVQRTR